MLRKMGWEGEGQVHFPLISLSLLSLLNGVGASRLHPTLTLLIRYSFYPSHFSY